VQIDAEALAADIAALSGLMGAVDASAASVTLPRSAPALWAVLERPGAFGVIADNGTISLGRMSSILVPVT
jgi:hypothetical protein